MHKERTTLPRQWALLRALPIYPKKISIRQLWNEMEDLGYEVTKRTIERDLINLSLQFSIVSDDAKPAGWSIRSEEGQSSKIIERLLPDVRPIISPSTDSVVPDPAGDEDENGVELEIFNKRFDPHGFFNVRPRHPKDFVGREWLLAKVDTWVNTDHSSLLWLQGAPGVGKTAFLSWLAHKRETSVLASFFCQYAHQKSTEIFARDAILSLATQLGRRLPAYRQQLLGHEQLDRTALDNQSATALFEYLIVQPLAALANSSDLKSDGQRYLLLIDGLDEACQTGDRNLLLEIILRFSRDLPKAVSIIISSRCETALCYPWRSVENLVLAQNDYNNQQDLCNWLNETLPTALTDTERLATTEALLRNSDGLFLYLKLIQPQLADFSQDWSRVPTGLDDFFLTSFQRFFPDIQKYSKQQRPLLELMSSAVASVTSQTLCHTLGWDQHSVDQIIVSFGSLFAEEIIDAKDRRDTLLYRDDNPSLDRRIIPFHKSLLDWLTDRNRAGLYRIIPQQGQQRWANGLWSVYQNDISSLDDYGLRFLPRHLSICGRFQDARQCLLDMGFILQRCKVPVVYADRYSIGEEYRQVQHNLPYDDALLAWNVFFRAKGHLLQKGHAAWPAERILLQLAAELSETSVVRKSADAYISNHPIGYWLRSTTPTLEPNCHLIEDDYDGPTPVILSDDRILGIAENGEICVWDGNSGQRLFTLSAIENVSDLLLLDDSHIVIWRQGVHACLQLWDIARGECTLSISNRGDIQQVCKLDKFHFIASFENFYVGIWNFIDQTVVEVDHLTHVVGHIWPLGNGFCLLDTDCRYNGNEDTQLLLWDAVEGKEIARLGSYPSNETIEVIQLTDQQVLSFTSDSEYFQIWQIDNGKLLASGYKQPNRAICVTGNALPLHILTALDPDDATPNWLLSVRSWLWDGLNLTVENNVDLVADHEMEFDLFDQSACVCDSQLFKDGRVLLPSPMSLWCGLTGVKIADLNGNWSLAGSTSDIGFYRYFDDGRLLTWSEPRWGDAGLPRTFYLSDNRGKLICEQNIDPLFFDIQIIDQNLFATFNCDDTLQIWDAHSGELRQMITGLGAKMEFALLLANQQLLVGDHAKHLSLWPLFSATPIVEQRHATKSKIYTLLLNDRIASYSKDAFPPRLWNANTGEWVATLPGYDAAVGAFLEGIVPLSRGRFLTWGHEPVLHIYDSQQGQCLATLQNPEKPHIGKTTVWPLQQDQILCLLWDNSLRIYDLQDNHFDTCQLIASHVKHALPVSTNQVIYSTASGVLKLWNVATAHHDVDLLGHIEDIERIQILSGRRVIVFAKKQPTILIDWEAGHTKKLDWLENSGSSQVTEITATRLALWSKQLLNIWDAEEAPSLRFALSFDNQDKLVFVGQLSDGNILTQVINSRATIWSIWSVESRKLVGSTILPVKSGQCVDSQCVDRSIFLRLSDELTGAECWMLLDWLNPENLQFIPIGDIKNPRDKLALKKLTSKLGLRKADWYFWSSLNGSSLGLSRLDESTINCEWHGQPFNQFIGLTDTGQVLGFARKPILLQLHDGNNPVTFET